ncbi:MAG: divergent polysaccharide deacetylase family protein [Candidatus Aminicenantales bacterium]|jgi:polysaccharide deacetylase 2 family uncharacterized protein YibQ
MINKPRQKKGSEPWPAFNLITAIMLGSAIVSVVTLDYMNSRKGERSYLFAAPEAKPAAAPEVKAPAEPVLKPGAAPTAAAPKTEAPPALKEPPLKEAPPKATKRVRGEVALIVDDMGNSLEALNEILSLKEPITVSVLPYSPYAQETARVAHDNGLEVLLHLPLESLNNHDASTDTEGMIMTTMSPDEIGQSFETSLARVPFADGVNNHMGSKFTADATLMRTLLAPFKDKGLFFVDSRTTAQTVAYDEALGMGIPALKRDVFLDADADRSRIKSRLIELFKLAQKKGKAVGICHPFPETLQVLRSSFRLFEKYSLEAVTVSRLVGK